MFSVKARRLSGSLPCVRIVGLDITLDGHRYGEWFDFVVDVVQGR